MIREKSKAKSKDSKENSKDAPARPAKGVIAVGPPSFRRERALIKRGVW
ncbi:MAG: ribonuclease HII, partial [Bradyrhizobium sp.]